MNELARLNPHLLERFQGWLDADKRLIGWRRFYIVIVALGLLFVLQGVVFTTLIAANRHRAHEIQASRVYSCEQTYQKIGEILRVSIAGRHLDAEGAQRLSRLLDLVDPTQCERQTDTSR